MVNTNLHIRPSFMDETETLRKGANMTVNLDTLLLAGIFVVLLIAAIFDSVTL